ncbi:hypothetical protein [Cerasicoccus maritimus]|uniref:hypothetical protein n=1 Tax=Cerasicoccus maritimus TaxID=490089 RepID=UPI002852A18E|nr:hypothetical protein [Cerasicoccus maritimus]
MTNAQSVLVIEGFQSTEVTLKPGRCELHMKGPDSNRLLAVENFVPLKRIVDLFLGFDKLEVIDQLSPDNPVESGRFLVRAHRGNEVIKGFCDQYEG